MEINGEQIIEKSKKTSKTIKCLYIICILAIIISAVVMNYREEKKAPTPIDFTIGGAVGMATDQYAYLKVEGLTDLVATYGNVDDDEDTSNDRYYIAISGGYLYIVDLKYETSKNIKELQDYLYSEDENAQAPEPMMLYGMTEEVPNELKNMILDYYNEAREESDKITKDEFDSYFGSVLLNERKNPVDTTIEEMIILFAVIALFLVVIIHISKKIASSKTTKYLQNSGYEEDIVRQLDDCVEEKHYKDKIILTKDYLVDIQNGLVAFKYSDVKWVHTHNVKYYGAITVSSSIIVYLNDGKTSLQCVEIKGGASDEFLEIFNKICEKIPADALKGYTKENIKAYKEYKKTL